MLLIKILIVGVVGYAVWLYAMAGIAKAAEKPGEAAPLDGQSSLLQTNLRVPMPLGAKPPKRKKKPKPE